LRPLAPGSIVAPAHHPQHAVALHHAVHGIARRLAGQVALLRGRR
jgi:hypothetical protein